MELRTLGRTGVKVSPLCLGAMMFGAWGNTDHDESIRDHPPGARRGDQLHRHRRRVLARASPRRSSARRSPAAGATRSCSPPRCTARWATTRTARATRAAGSSGESRTACAAWAPTGSTSTRSTGPTPRPTSTRPWARSPTSSAPGKIRYLGSSTFPAHEIVEAQWVAERRGRERFVCEQPPYSMLVRGDRGRGAAGLRALRDGRDHLEPARRRLAHRPLPRGRGAADLGAGRADPAALRHVAAGQPGEARRGRAAREARRGARDQPRPPGARVRARAPGRDERDHRAAHDGAARVPARRAPSSGSSRDASTGSTRSCRRASTSTTPPTPAGSRPSLADPASRRR